MFKNYLKIAFRSLLKNKLQTSINLLGLTLGTVCCLIIITYVVAQLGYDQHHSKSASLYRVNTKLKTIDNASIDAYVSTASPPIAFALKEDFPEVLEACRVVYFGSGEEELLRNEATNESYYESRGYVVDSTFFKLFDYDVIEGDLLTSLQAPNSIVLSKKLSQKLFKGDRALSRNLVVGSGENQFEATVTGVFDTPQSPTHLNPNYILGMNSPGVGAFVRSVTSFATQNFAHTYIELAPKTTEVQLEKKLPAFIKERGANDLAEMGFEKKLLLQPVTDIHLYSKDITMSIEEVSNIEYLYVLLLLALIVQLVACINFINLSTARASKRGKEIGIRKAIGAQKSMLIRQFLSESTLLALFAVLIGIPIAALLLPLANTITGGSLIFTDLLDIKILSLVTVVGFVTGILAGIYPALVLSAFRPSIVLKGTNDLKSNNGLLRKGLVVFQFVVAICLTISVIVVTQQLRFAQEKDLGFNKENLLALRLGTQKLRQDFTPLKSQLANVPGVNSVSGSNNYPSRTILGDLAMRLPNQSDANLTSVYYNGITPNYFEVVGTKILAGRPLRENDSSGVVVNQATLKAFDISLENALATTLVSSFNGETENYEIVGVAEDFHFATLKQVIQPMLMYNDSEPDWLIVKMETSNVKSVMTGLENRWKELNAYAPFEYVFIDQEAEILFAEEHKLAKISSIFTILAILISCMGLYGLVSYVAEQKKKEIGIRKVLGASINSVIRLLTTDFLKLVVIAFLIASPIAYYFMQNWLEDFTYRIDIQWWVFVLAGGFALFITIITVGFQSLKSAVANPVKSLRAE